MNKIEVLNTLKYGPKVLLHSKLQEMLSYSHSKLIYISYYFLHKDRLFNHEDI